MTFVLDDDALPPWSASQETGASPDYGCLPALASRSVSYTHLTLPTILLV